MSRHQQSGGFPLGSRIKAIRESHGLSQRELARRAQITNANLSMIEQDKVSPAMTTLEKILSAMELDLAGFFASAEPVASVCKAEDFTLVRRKGAKFWLMEAASGLRYTIRAVVEPGAQLGSLWLRGQGFVSGVLLDGQLELVLNDAPQRLMPGDGFEFLLNRKHGFANRSEASASLIIFVDVKP